MTEYGLHSSATYSDISDSDLDTVVRELKQEHINGGYRLLDGYLDTRGIRVQQIRIRGSLHRCDPKGVTSRWLGTVHSRCKYSV